MIAVGVSMLLRKRAMAATPMRSRPRLAAQAAAVADRLRGSRVGLLRLLRHRRRLPHRPGPHRRHQHADPLAVGSSLSWFPPSVLRPLPPMRWPDLSTGMPRRCFWPVVSPVPHSGRGSPAASPPARRFLHGCSPPSSSRSGSMSRGRGRWCFCEGRARRSKPGITFLRPPYRGCETESGISGLACASHTGDKWRLSPGPDRGQVHL